MACSQHCSSDLQFACRRADVVGELHTGADEVAPDADGAAAAADVADAAGAAVVAAADAAAPVTAAPGADVAAAAAVAKATDMHAGQNLDALVPGGLGQSSLLAA